MSSIVTREITATGSSSCHMSPSATRWAVTTLVVLLHGCAGGEQTVIEPPPVQGSDFTLTIAPDPEDLAVAEALGWSAGISGAEVTIAPVDSSAPPRLFHAGNQGTLVITGLPSGKYLVKARRLFSTGELGSVAGTADALAFVGEGHFDVSDGLRTAIVRIPASHRRSIVISEWSFRARLVRGIGTYQFGGFLELYNNADSAVFLDGVLILKPWAQLVSWPGFPCESTEGFRNDPAGPWSQNASQFPGSGAEFPLAPGASVVIATDAIDHRDLFPGMLDLRTADFEFIGSSDVDNPAVPNMIDVGTTAPPLGHGLIFPNPGEVTVALGAPHDAATLRRGRHMEGGVDEWIQVPRAKVIDAMSTASTYYLTLQPPRPFCAEMLIESLDRMHGFFLYEDEQSAWQFSITRKVLTRAPDGRPILQHTRTSANDFHNGMRSPGAVP